MGRSNKVGIFLSPFLYIGWVAVMTQIIFAALRMQEANLICVVIALSCFATSMIHTIIHSERSRKERIDEILKTMDEIEKRNKQNREKLD